MRIIICYASTEGQTRKIARFCLEHLAAQGHAVELLPAGDAGGLELAGADAVILAGSVHLGKLQASLADFAASHAEVLNGMPTMLLQVSLAVVGTDPDEHADLDRIARDFCTRTGWQPGAVHQIAGAFRFTEYDFFKGWAMRYIAAKRDDHVDPHTDTEYTDWAALAALLKGWPA